MDGLGYFELGVGAVIAEVFCEGDETLFVIFCVPQGHVAVVAENPADTLATSSVPTWATSVVVVNMPLTVMTLRIIYATSLATISLKP